MQNDDLLLLRLRIQEGDAHWLEANGRSGITECYVFYHTLLF